MSVAIVTCQEMPEPDVDESLLMQALADADVDAELVAWDDPSVAWSEFAAAVLRSPWNYIAHLDRFLSWAGQVNDVTRLLNPLPVIEWNTHKGYLRDLQRKGVHVVPTAWVDPDERVDLATLMAQRGWNDVVAKPVVGAGSFLTDRVTDPDSQRARTLWAALCDNGEVMVQPYMSSVDSYGERSIIWIDGEFTHAIRKSPRLGDAPESVSEALPIADDELQLASTVIGDMPHQLLYARIDVIRADDGAPLLAELELVEPSLFLRQQPDALHRLVAAIKKLAK